MFSGYVDEGERLAVEYLPHTGYGAIVPSERRGISVRDGETGEVVDLTVFSGYVDEGERLAVEYLPHTGYGAIVERG